MDWISEELRSGWLQKVQGPMPSFTQMILPQERQLGAASSRGCRVAMQLQRRFEMSWLEDRVGFVCISRARMADSRSLMAEEAPCMGVPPGMLILVLGFEGFCFMDIVRGGLGSEIIWPAAEGGSFAGRNAGACGCGGGGEGPRDLGAFCLLEPDM